MSHLCETCQLSNLCKIADENNSIEGVTRQVTDCIHYKGTVSVVDKSFAAFLNERSTLSQEKVLREQEVRPERDIMHDVSDISDQIHAVSQDAVEEPEIIPPQEGVECSICHRDNLQLIRCSECGELVCGDCYTETLSHKALCLNCYDKDEGSIL